ncbi:MAG: hypothetical protein ACRDD2_14520 [Sarcina sp.]
MENLINTNVQPYYKEPTELYDSSFHAYFFIPEPCFFQSASFMELFWAVDPALKDDEKVIAGLCSILVTAAWDFYTGLAYFNGVIGTIVSCTVKDVINFIVDTFDGLRDAFNQAKENCSRAPYPYSSWELILELTWDVSDILTLTDPTISWSFQGTNPPKSYY